VGLAKQISLKPVEIMSQLRSSRIKGVLIKSKAVPDLQRQMTTKDENDTDQADSVKTVVLESRMMARKCSDDRDFAADVGIGPGEGDSAGDG
jgi:hypothetical protein